MAVCGLIQPVCGLALCLIGTGGKDTGRYAYGFGNEPLCRRLPGIQR